MNPDHPNPNSTPAGLTDRQAELLSALADGELTGAELAEAQALLAGSPVAARVLERFRAVSAAVQSLPSPTPAVPEETTRFASRVLGEIEALQHRVVVQAGVGASSTSAHGGGFRRRAWGLGLLATAAALLLMAINRGDILPWAERRNAGPKDVAIRPLEAGQPLPSIKAADEPLAANGTAAGRKSISETLSPQSEQLPSAAGAFGKTTELAAEAEEKEFLLTHKQEPDSGRQPTIASVEQQKTAPGSGSSAAAESFSYSPSTPPIASAPSPMELAGISEIRAAPAAGPLAESPAAEATPAEALADESPEADTPLEGLLRESKRYFVQQQRGTVGDSLLVLRVSTNPEALASNYFGRILAENRLALTELQPFPQQDAATLSLADAAKPTSAGAPSAGGAFDGTSSSDAGGRGLRGEVGEEVGNEANAAALGKLQPWDRAVQAELVLIDAPQAQIDRCVEELRRDATNFRTIELIREPVLALGRQPRQQASPINETEGTQLRFAVQQLRRLNGAAEQAQSDRAARVLGVDLLGEQAILANQPVPRMLLAAPMDVSAGATGDAAADTSTTRSQALFFFTCPADSPAVEAPAATTPPTEAAPAEPE